MEKDVKLVEMMDSKQEKIKNFDPNGVGEVNGNLYGLPFTPEEAETVVIPVPWDVTVSYTAGTSGGPQAILNASPQLDLHDPVLENAWQYGIAMLDIPDNLITQNKKMRQLAESHIDKLEEGYSSSPKQVAEVNRACERMTDWVKEQAEHWLAREKRVVLLGGDHSTPLGLMQAYREKEADFGILQIDAHADLRQAYEGFEQSHASIMHNVLDQELTSKLVQVGIRDYCSSEMDVIQNDERVTTFFERELRKQQFSGISWSTQCEEIAGQLPHKVYISFDIDGLHPSYCPNTGTPVPGGMEFEEVLYLIETVMNSGRKIIGFDLVEVTPGEEEWDANVGARILYRMNNLMIKSHQDR